MVKPHAVLQYGSLALPLHVQIDLSSLGGLIYIWHLKLCTMLL